MVSWHSLNLSIPILKYYAEQSSKTKYMADVNYHVRIDRDWPSSTHCGWFGWMVEPFILHHYNSTMRKVLYVLSKTGQTRESLWTGQNIQMIQIGRYKLGFAPLSMIVVFIVPSVCAIVTAFHQARPECPMPLSHTIIINEGMVLLTTLIYGIFAHFTIAIINRLRKLISRSLGIAACRWMVWRRKLLLESSHVDMIPFLCSTSLTTCSALRIWIVSHLSLWNLSRRKLRKSVWNTSQ